MVSSLLANLLCVYVTIAILLSNNMRYTMSLTKLVECFQSHMLKRFLHVFQSKYEAQNFHTMSCTVTVVVCVVRTP